MSASAPANDVASTPQGPVDPNAVQLYVNNLSFATTNETLAKFLNDRLGVAPLVTNIIHRNGRHGTHSRGFGFVDVPKDKLNAAVALSGTELDGRSIGIVEAKQRSEEDRAAAREKRTIKQKERAAKRAADKATGAPADATATGAAKSTEAGSGGGRTRQPRIPVERPTFPDSAQLYLNNLSFDVTADDIKRLFFDTIGKEPLDVDIVTSKFGQFEGRSRGFGFVTVSKADEATALALNGRQYEGRDLGVVIARPRPMGANGEQKEGSGGRRRPRGRGGRGGGNNDVAADADVATGNASRRRVPNPADAEAAAAGQTDDGIATGAPPRRGRRGGRRRPRGGAATGTDTAQ